MINSRFGLFGWQRLPSKSDRASSFRFTLAISNTTTLNPDAQDVGSCCSFPDRVLRWAGTSSFVGTILRGGEYPQHLFGLGITFECFPDIVS